MAWGRKLFSGLSAKAHLGQIGLEIRETMNLSYLEYGAFGPNHKCLEKSLRIVLLA